MEASMIRHLPHEEKLVQTLIRSLEGINYKTLFFAGIQSFDSLIRIRKELEYDIKFGRNTYTQIPLYVLKKSLDERNEDHSSSNFDPSKNCVYHSNIQGHDIEECEALRNKIQNMIENGKIIVQQGLQNNNCNPSMANTFTVQGDPTKM
ncbi:hypothetical protein MTR_0030s0370 [Medicago truncatula]|uniref:Uncharacterized protein n=1 Tax=Medicago truncatula TaxID=3880 RepID=G7ZUH5_MEDTR|nr:hypothetical protein MTR_0030s0370 [Medicago truncatula]